MFDKSARFPSTNAKPPNKIDLPAADPEKVLHDINEVIGIETDNAILISAKTGQGVHELMNQIVKIIPSPIGNPDEPLQALIIDSWFDKYVGVVSLLRIVNGRIKKGDLVMLEAMGGGFTWGSALLRW